MLNRKSALALAAAAVMITTPPARAASGPSVNTSLQHLIDSYVASRAAIEGVSGVALLIDRGGANPPVSFYTGNDGLAAKQPIGPATLFQIGSNTKLFCAVLILKLEAQGKLKIDQPIGDFLPQYPAWRTVTIRSLLNMTSQLPNYSETIGIAKQLAGDMHHQFTDADLIAAVYPGRSLPRPPPWFYSNTNNILAALIVEAVTHRPFGDVLQSEILQPLGLHDTFYPTGATPAEWLARLPRGLYLNAACQLYQPTPCKRPTLGPLVGKDMRTQNLSWAGAAGAMISTPHDVDIWLRALFAGRVLPAAQMAELKTIVSMKTGAPLADVGAENPAAFGLDIAKVHDAANGTSYWFYQGETMGYRVVFAYYPAADLLIVGATNSQAPDGQDTFGKTIVGGAASIMNAAPPPIKH